MTIIKPPKFVKKANAWVVTTITRDDKGKISQTQEWFSEKPK